MINPAVADAAAAHGWPAALDAASTILMSLLTAALGADEARTACARMYEHVARLESAWGPIVAKELGDQPQGRA